MLPILIASDHAGFDLKERLEANVLALPARFLSEDQARQIVKTWLETPFEAGRHERRIEKIEREHRRLADAPNEQSAEHTETRS